MNTIILPHGNGAPSLANLPNYGLGVDTKNYLLYYRNNNVIVPISAPTQIFVSGSEPTSDKDMIWFDDSAQEEVYFMKIKKAGSSDWYTPLTHLDTGTTGILKTNKGGTGKSSWTASQLVYAPNANSLGQITNAVGALYYDGSGTPKFGTLPLTKGGTGATSKSGAQKSLGIQYGTASITTRTSGANSTVNVTFPTAYSSVPKVIVSQVFNDKNIVVLKENVSATGFTATLESGFSSVVTREFDWIAISS